MAVIESANTKRTRPKGTFLRGPRFIQCHTVHTFFLVVSRVRELANPLPLPFGVATRLRSSSVPVSCAQTCFRFLSTCRSLDPDVDGFPVLAFLPVRTSRLLPRPSADCSNRRSVGQLKVRGESKPHFRFAATCRSYGSSMYHVSVILVQSKDSRAVEESRARLDFRRVRGTRSTSRRFILFYFFPSSARINPRAFLPPGFLLIPRRMTGHLSMVTFSQRLPNLHRS